MTYTLIDLGGLLLATVAHGLVVVLPAIATAHYANVFGFRHQPPLQGIATALVVAYAILPVVDSLVASLVGLTTALALNLLLALAGARIALRWPPLCLGRLALIACAAWLTVIALATVDFDWNGRLHISLLMIDTVKHAATVRALLDTGAAPPVDPFFLRGDPAGYYYYFYVASALVARLGMGLIDARAAFAGQIFWIGLALFALIHLVLRRAGLERSLPQAAPRHLLLGALAIVGGLQLLPVAAIAAGTDLWLAQSGWWSEQVTSLPLSALWVPHHVASLIACWTGLLLLAQAVTRTRNTGTAARDQVPAVVLAGLAFASAAGLSIWVAATACVAISAWLLLLALERRWSALALVLASGFCSALLSLPYLLDLVHFRAQGQFPVALSMRQFPFSDVFFAPGLVQSLARLCLLPLNYAIEFGVLALGAFLYWRTVARLPTAAPARETRRLLVLSALAGLVIASFCQSTILSNDLAWRAILFAQVAAVVWSFAAFAPYVRYYLENRHPPRSDFAAASLVAASLGFAVVAYDLAALRLYAPLGLAGIPDIERDAAVDRELRQAYETLAGKPHAPQVMQHNPDAVRTFPHGLYGKARVAVSDRHNGMLFGASAAAVSARVGEIIPVFADTLSGAEARRRLLSNGIDALVVTRSDPLWRDEKAWIWHAPTLFASANVRVISVGNTP